MLLYQNTNLITTITVLLEPDPEKKKLLYVVDSMAEKAMVILFYVFSVPLYTNLIKMAWNRLCHLNVYTDQLSKIGDLICEVC